MPDQLWISGGGSTAVATDELYAASTQLGRLSREASGLAVELAVIDDLISPSRLQAAQAPPEAARAERDLGQARAILQQLEHDARILEWALTSAADGYGFVEMFLHRFAGALLGTVVGSLGMVAPGIVFTAVSAIGLARLAGVDGQDVSTMLSSAGVVDAVRMGVMTADDALLGLAGVPGALAHVLGESGAGVTGLPFAALATMVGASAFGLLRESPVTLVSTTPRPASAPPAGFAARFDRVPSLGIDGGQVVIEKYETPGKPDSFAVYIAGTVSFDPAAATEPWDITSNIANAVGPGSGSYESVVIAMEQAGIDSASPVQFTGYSQGGGTAAQLVASGHYNAVGLVTFGGPTGQVNLPADIPTVLVEHRDDIVPALGGTQQNLHAVIVERDVFGGQGIPDDKPIPAHHREYYRDTAVLMDSAQSEQVTAIAAELALFGAEATIVTSTAYRFERVSASS